ncbi:hypothetical protein KVR01_009863 [Diaporthe batatas]|uniref:uncharacterized protein n=1 Tax=Diaporthe batatas TaxID=748121 RepID=UPI001D04FBE7|nr:uncharacterized protein KVR01_009863 [Diaporthe batatas]KAG8160327.1 hypothetical protein KVR01_009863 [Diaporthe batatas]
MASPPLYTPLDPSSRQIRLLQVDCSEIDDESTPVSCRMVTASLDDASLEYIALSYVWGVNMSQTPLLINGTKFKATGNLFDFLARYRKISCVIPKWELANFSIWIDAVCINQDDFPERNSQVQIMGSIYRSATRTISWLGPDDDQSESALTTLKDIYPKMMDSIHKRNLLGWVDPQQTNLWQENEKGAGATSLTRNNFWHSCQKILQRAYFTRSWITQELVLSRNVVLLCGQQTLPLIALTIVWLWLHHIEGLSCPPHVNARLWSLLSTREGRRVISWGVLNKLPNLSNLMRDSKNVPEEGLALIWHELVLHARIQQATDPRDKLYSVLGLLDRKFKPDYAASIEDVFCNFAKENIDAEKRLSVLREAGHGTFFDTPEHPRHNLFVPSWVPDWDALSKEFTWGLIYHGEYRLCADGNRPPRLRKVGDSETITLSQQQDGYCFKIVGRTLTVVGLICDSTSAVRRLAGSDYSSWAPFCEEYISSRGENDRYVTGIPLLQALARMLFLDLDPITRKNIDHSTPLDDMLKICVLGILTLGSQDHPPAPRFGITSHSILVDKFIGSGTLGSRLLESGTLPEGLFDASTLSNHVSKLTSNWLSLVMNYVAFWTSDGFLGWGPPGMKETDHVCVIIGCDVPVVLRRIDDHYIHIGPCWVLGIMNGEVIKDASNGASDFVTFDIV